MRKKLDKKIPEYVGKGTLLENLSKNAEYTFKKKYLKKDEGGEIIESVGECFYRVAKAIGNVEKDYGKSKEEIYNFTKSFYSMMANGFFMPGGRVLTNTGTDIKSLFNCYVLPVKDSLGDIYESVRYGVMIHKVGGGTGYNFSEIRPRGTYVKKSKGIASGPISFMGSFDQATEVINSGNRRGANMGILECWYPQILEFIPLKEREGNLENFNLSVGISNKFMKAVENKEHYDLEFPEHIPFKSSDLESIIKNIEKNNIGGSSLNKAPQPAFFNFDSEKVIPGKTNIIDPLNEEVVGRVNKEGIVQLFAPYVFDKIATSAHKSGGPGLIFLDKLNENNPLPKIGPIKATNPCGEQPLFPYEACNLGSINLSTFYNSKDKKSKIDYKKLEEVVGTAIRFMDNVNDFSKGPIPKIERKTKENRRVGLGVLGWADLLIKLKVSYGSEESFKLAEKVMGFINQKSKETSVELAKEKSVFPSFEKSKYNNGKLEDRVRNLERTTIAPTGTISMVLDSSSGIEPLFAMAYRKHIRGGDSLKYIHPLLLEEFKKRNIDSKNVLPLIENNYGSVQGIKEIPEDIQKIFKIASDLTYKEHILMQAAFQRNIDNAVSKTINMKNSTTVKEIKDAYLFAWKSGLKGMTVYRDGSKKIQVLTTGTSEEKLEKLISERLNKPRPEEVFGKTVKVKTPYDLSAFITSNFQKTQTGNKPEECFINIGKAGSDLSAISEGYGRLISMAFRAGIPLEYIIEQLKGIGGETQNGIGKDKVRSLPDAIAKGLEKTNPKEIQQKSPLKEKSGNLCPECGNPLIMEEGCQRCSVCSYSKC